MVSHLLMHTDRQKRPLAVRCSSAYSHLLTETILDVRGPLARCMSYRRLLNCFRVDVSENFVSGGPKSLAVTLSGGILPNQSSSFCRIPENECTVQETWCVSCSTDVFNS